MVELRGTQDSAEPLLSTSITRTAVGLEGGVMKNCVLGRVASSTALKLLTVVYVLAQAATASGQQQPNNGAVHGARVPAPLTTPSAQITQTGGGSGSSKWLWIALRGGATASSAHLREADQSCKQQIASLATVGLTATCSYPNGAAGWSIEGGVDISRYGAALVSIHRIGTVNRSDSGAFGTSSTFHDSVNFGPWTSVGVIGEGHVQAGRLIPYVQIGAAHWHIDHVFSSNITNNATGAVTRESTSSKPLTGWSPVFGTGLQVVVQPHVLARIGYELDSVGSSGITEHYDQLQVGVDFRFR